MTTPQSVSVITHERIEQQNINDFTKALAAGPGRVLRAGDAAVLKALFYSRGHGITSVQIDGGAPLIRRFTDPEQSVSYFHQIDSGLNGA